MKKLAAILTLGLLATSASAADQAFDLASNAAYSGNQWPTNSNGGTGYNGWTFLTNGSGNRGRFIGSSTDNNNNEGSSTNPLGSDVNSSGTNTNAAFGLFAAANNDSYAYRTFANSGTLNIGQTFSLLMDNGNVNNSARVGFALRSDSQRRANIFFRGGDSNYTVQGGDTSTFGNSNVGFTRFGIEVTFTLVTTDSATVTVRRLSGGSPVVTTLTSLGGTAGSLINGFELYNIGAGDGSISNVYFNAVATPEPSAAAILGVAAAGLLRRKR